MSMISYYKRRCDKEVEGCGREVDITRCVSVVRGKLHLCLGCAAKQLRLQYSHRHGKKS